MKPLFYMLAQHGPWTCHVRFTSSEAFNKACEWLYEGGKVEAVDFETLVSGIQNGSRYAGDTSVNTLDRLIFFKDTKLASYVKLTWGGR
jgi:hypothetical protein